ncbi:MAG: hypothetical protein ABJA67_17705 [Chthonomonadales bacterium]
MFNWIEDYIKAGSPKVSSKQLALLAYKKHPKIRLRVAENPKTPEEVIAFLTKDKDPDVRLAVGILNMLAEDDNAYVSCRARKTLETLESADQSCSAKRSHLWTNHNERCFA